MNFPTIHTNIWDAVIAIPVIMSIMQLLKLSSISRAYFPTIAQGLGLLISMFISHRGDLWAGLFMGFFYGNAAIGSYEGLKIAILAYRSKTNIDYR